MAKNVVTLYEQGAWRKWVIPVIAIVTIITCIQLLHGKSNNFTIFRYSSLHLLAHQPLYSSYPDAYYDFFLYYPSFTVLFMPFALLPAPLALWLWTCLSTLVFVRAIMLLPGITDAAKKTMLLLALPELINNLQYAQTNIFLVSLMLLTFIYFEKGALIWAALFTAMAFCIKGYGGIVGLLFILYPGKLKFTSYAFLWVVLITALPLLFVSFNETITLYTDWFQMISSDGIKESISLIGVFGHTHSHELYITLAGFLLLLLSVAPSVRYAAVRNNFHFRGLLCCYLFVWVVLFNRAAESPTYQLAITGFAYWFALLGYHRKNIYIAAVLMLLVYVLPSDLFPAIFHQVFRDYHLKIYPFTLFYLYLQYQLFSDAKKLIVSKQVSQ
ncbi:MAG: glycosyltransferase family 87 protein [Chitinophagaceae bacterium]